MSTTFYPSRLEHDVYKIVEGHELNLSNTNCYWLLTALDIDPDPCGSIHPRDLCERIERLRRALELNPSEFTRADVRVDNVIYHGVDRDRMLRYCNELEMVAHSAAIEECLVGWA